MIYNVIPINYNGGLGGQFLSSFLCSARKNTPTNWIFSKDGNTHEAEKDWANTPYGFGQDPTGSKNINFLIEYAKTIPENVVAYPHGHYGDPDLLMQYVYKQIKIYADPEQYDEVTGVFILKHPKFNFGLTNLTDPIEKEKYKNHPIIRWRKFTITRFSRLYNSCPDLEPRMLNVSWNDMLYNDTEILITKLHNFTEIPKENFNREKFVEWRQLTHKTVNRLREAKLI